MIDPIELHAWADGEIAKEHEASVRRILAESAEARAELQSIMALKEVLRRRIPEIECSAEWKACVGRLNEFDKVHRVERLASGRFAWGLSGVFFAAILVAGFLHRGVDSTKVTSADLARVLGTFSHVHRSSTSKETDDMISDLLDKAKIVIDKHRLDVLGREYGDLDGHVATRYLLRDASGYLNLIIVPNVYQIDENGEIPRDHKFRPLTLENHPCVAWTDGRGTLILEGDRSFEDLATVASGFH